jgi:3-methyladenine DNA glycosylase AlkD
MSTTTARSSKKASATKARVKSAPTTATRAAASKPPAKAAAVKAAKPAPPRMTLKEAMSELEKAGSAQTRKTYARHGASEPMFGVSFATLKTLAKRIKVDHELACALWDTGNFDARNLAYKIVEPARMSSGDLDRWAGDPVARMCGAYVARAGWSVVASMAMRDESTPDDWFASRLAEIEKRIHSAPNSHREAMNSALIAIGCRSAALRKAALAAAKRIGKVDVDHGDTDCKTPDAGPYIEKTWAHSTSKGYESPAAHERAREPMRVRC